MIDVSPSAVTLRALTCECVLLLFCVVHHQVVWMTFFFSDPDE